MRFGPNRALPGIGRITGPMPLAARCRLAGGDPVLSIYPATPEGINPGAAFRLSDTLGMCGQQADAEGEGSAARGRNQPQAPFDPKVCDHRHHFRRWSSVRKDHGFDDGSMRRSQWQLVPLGGSREVELLWDRLFPKQVFSEQANIASAIRHGD